MRLYRVTCLSRDDHLMRFWEGLPERAKVRQQKMMEDSGLREGEVEVSNVEVPDDEEGLAQFLNEMQARHGP